MVHPVTMSVFMEEVDESLQVVKLFTQERKHLERGRAWIKLSFIWLTVKATVLHTPLCGFSKIQSS